MYMVYTNYDEYFLLLTCWSLHLVATLKGRIDTRAKHACVFPLELFIAFPQQLACSVKLVLLPLLAHLTAQTQLVEETEGVEDTTAQTQIRQALQAR
jgi:hypothetical protein